MTLLRIEATSTLLGLVIRVRVPEGGSGVISELPLFIVVSISEVRLGEGAGAIAMGGNTGLVTTGGLGIGSGITTGITGGITGGGAGVSATATAIGSGTEGEPTMTAAGVGGASGLRRRGRS